MTKGEDRKDKSKMPIVLEVLKPGRSEIPEDERTPDDYTTREYQITAKGFYDRYEKTGIILYRDIVGGRKKHRIVYRKKRPIVEEPTPEQPDDLDVKILVDVEPSEGTELPETVETPVDEVPSVDEVPLVVDRDITIPQEVEDVSGQHVYLTRFEETLYQIKADPDYSPGGIGTLWNGIRMLGSLFGLSKIKPKAIRQRPDMLKILEDIKQYNLRELEEAMDYLSDRGNREELMRDTLYFANNPRFENEKEDYYQAFFDAKIQLAEIENTVKKTLRQKRIYA